MPPSVEPAPAPDTSPAEPKLVRKRVIGSSEPSDNFLIRVWDPNDEERKTLREYSVLQLVQGNVLVPKTTYLLKGTFTELRPEQYTVEERVGDKTEVRTKTRYVPVTIEYTYEIERCEDLPPNPKQIDAGSRSHSSNPLLTP